MEVILSRRTLTCHSSLTLIAQQVNDWLASGLGKGTCKPITPAENPPAGQEEAGSGRLFTFEEPTNLTTVVERVKKLIGLPHCECWIGESLSLFIIRTNAMSL